MTRLRVAYLNPVAQLGGAERVLLDLFAAAPEVEAHLVMAEEGPLGEAARARGAQVHLAPMPPGLQVLGDSALRAERGLGERLGSGLRLSAAAPAAARDLARYLGTLRRTLAGIGPRLIHSNALKTHLLTPALGPTPILWHVHDYVGARPLMARALRWPARRAAGAVVVSRSLAGDLRQALPGLDLRVVPNAIDLKRFQPGPGDGAWLDRLAGLPTPAGPLLRVGLVASYGRWKGQDVFLRAAARLRTRPELRFFVVGGAIYRTAGSQFSRDELRALAASLGLAERVGFVDFQPDPAPVYRALDLVVHASVRPEPFGLTIAEAMACGRPLIVAPAGGAAELFREGVEARGAAPGDPAALAGVIAALAADPEQRAALARRAAAAARTRFDRARLGRTVVAHYRRLLGAQPG